MEDETERGTKEGSEGGTKTKGHLRDCMEKI